MVTFGKFLDKNVCERMKHILRMAGLMQLLARRLKRLIVCVLVAGVADVCPESARVASLIVKAWFQARLIAMSRLPIFCGVHSSPALTGMEEAAGKCHFPLVDAGVCLFKQWISSVGDYTTRQCAKGQR
jgi:hypothetical protein